MIAFRHRRAYGLRGIAWGGLVLLMAAWLLGGWGGGGTASAKEADTCIECHKDPQFLVTNKKLYDYFQDWQRSVHGQENIGCAECHGGDPTAKDKEAAHRGAGLAAREQGSPISYQNVPKTCAQCHDKVYAQFTKSKHFKRLEQSKSSEKQVGPNCVTCHGSVNTTVLSVTTVRATCANCHNAKSGNHPDIPAHAEEMLNEFLSIHRYYRYLTTHGNRAESLDFFRMVENETDDLMIYWHSFDLDNIEKRTRSLITVLQEKRNDLKRLSKKREP